MTIQGLGIARNIDTIEAGSKFCFGIIFPKTLGTKSKSINIDGGTNWTQFAASLKKGIFQIDIPTADIFLPSRYNFSTRLENALLWMTVKISFSMLIRFCHQFILKGFLIFNIFVLKTTACTPKELII